MLSLGPLHSFPLADVFRYLHPETTRDVLVQAFLDAPVFETRWRWCGTLSLAVPRNRGGHKVAPQIQRMLAEDLLASVFPDAAACLENIPGDREIPDHPLVNQAVRDCLEEAMDFEELRRHAVQMRRGADRRDDLGALDPAAIERVRAEERPDPHDADELHDALMTGGFLTSAECEAIAPELIAELRARGRATLAGGRLIATE